MKDTAPTAIVKVAMLTIVLLFTTIAGTDAQPTSLRGGGGSAAQAPAPQPQNHAPVEVDNNNNNNHNHQRERQLTTTAPPIGSLTVQTPYQHNNRHDLNINADYYDDLENNVLTNDKTEFTGLPQQVVAWNTQLKNVDPVVAERSVDFTFQNGATNGVTVTTVTVFVPTRTNWGLETPDSLSLYLKDNQPFSKLHNIYELVEMKDLSSMSITDNAVTAITFTVPMNKFGSGNIINARIGIRCPKDAGEKCGLTEVKFQGYNSPCPYGQVLDPSKTTTPTCSVPINVLANIPAGSQLTFNPDKDELGHQCMFVEDAYLNYSTRRIVLNELANAVVHFCSNLGVFYLNPNLPTIMNFQYSGYKNPNNMAVMKIVNDCTGEIIQDEQLIVGTGSAAYQVIPR